MKKIIIILILVLLFILSGCSLQDNKTPAEQTSISQTGNSTSSNNINPVKPTPSENDDNGWFIGAINETLKIHMKLNIIGDKVSGIYYYDKYKKNITLTGEINNNLISVSEKDSTGYIDAILVSDELIEGIWSDGKNTYPFYVIKEESKISIPEKPDLELIKWEGDWTGQHSGYYSGSELLIYPIFNNLIRFEISAFSGTHSGGFSSVALIENNIAVYKGENNTEFKFSLNDDGDIRLDTNDYTYYCGMGVGYDSIFTKEILSISPPSAIEAGLVYTDEQENIFKKLTGEYYDAFIQNAQYYTDEEDLDQIGADVRVFRVLGYFNTAIVMINQEDNMILAAVDGGDFIYYFTNNKNYLNPPKTIIKWSSDKGKLKIITPGLDIPRKYTDYIKGKNDYDKNDNILFYNKEDIDLDGNDEIIIASGIYGEDHFSSYISQIYILHDNNGEIEQLGENLAYGGYYVYEIKLIQLQNKPNKYIYCGLTNGENLTGFKIIELTNNETKEIYYSASATGAGNDILKDFDNDGSFDGFVQNRWSYDVLYYTLSRTFTFTNNDFELIDTYVEIPEYPNNIKDVIIQYLSLRVLNVEKSSEVDKLLSELCIYDKANEFDFSTDEWYLAIQNSLFFDDAIKFDIIENGNDAEVTVILLDDNDKEYKRKFHLINSDNRWIIDSIN